MSERRPAVIHRVVLAVLTVFLCGGVARASDISFLCASALQGSMQTLLPEFEAASGHHVTVQYGNIGTNTERVRRGDAADLAIVSPAQFDSLQKDGKVSSSVSAVIGKTGFAVSVKKGASRPDIGTVEAFKQVLLAAHRLQSVIHPAGRRPGSTRCSCWTVWGSALRSNQNCKLCRLAQETSSPMQSPRAVPSLGSTPHR